jgi:hypothetical protein
MLSVGLDPSPRNQDRTARMAHDPSRIGADGRPMRSDDEEVSSRFVGNPRSLGIDASAVSNDDVGLEVGGIGASDQGGNPALRIRDVQLIASRRRLRLQNGLKLARHCQDMEVRAERPRKLDCREQRLLAGRFVIEVKGNENVFVHVTLTLSFAITSVVDRHHPNFN